MNSEMIKALEDLEKEKGIKNVVVAGDMLIRKVSKLGDLAGEGTGTFKTIVTGAVGVGNAILQFLLMPIRNVIDAAKGLGNVFSNVFKGQFKEAANAAKEAVKDIGENIKKGFSLPAFCFNNSIAESVSNVLECLPGSNSSQCCSCG